MDMHLTSWMFCSLCFFSTLLDGARGQKRIVQLQAGGTFTIDCTLEGSLVIYLYKRLSQETMVLFWNSTSKELTANRSFQDRVMMESNHTNFRFNLTDLKESDSGVYWCSSKAKRVENAGFAVLVVVSDGACQSPRRTDGSQVLDGGEDSSPGFSFLVPTIGLIVVFLFLSVAILAIIFMIKMKKCCNARDAHVMPTDSIYEDMQRHNTSL